MRHGDDFLARLGLRGDAPADARSIRRAYARELKQIDQEADPAGFQCLRQAYEAALQWADEAVQLPRQENMSTATEVPTHLPASTMASPQRPPELSADLSAESSPASSPLSHRAVPESVNPAAWAGQVFSHLLVACAILAQGPQCHDDDAWEAGLRRCQDDPLLLNIAARDHFEARLVELLGQGWQRGHEALLVAAVTVFDWANDRRRLLRFGRAGAMIERGIDEGHLFTAQSDDDQAAQRLLVSRLRSRRAATPAEVLRNRFHYAHLTARFPAMMILLVGSANMARWQRPSR